MDSHPRRATAFAAEAALAEALEMQRLPAARGVISGNPTAIG
jgi:hypothetical protein